MHCLYMVIDKVFRIESGTFQQCFDEAEKSFDEMTAREKKMGRDDWAHGSLLIINELLRCSNIEGEVCRYKFKKHFECSLQMNVQVIFFHM